jgi:acetyltransferase-like isoleucine patch superfamily enzyme
MPSMTLVSLLKQKCKPGSSLRWVLAGLYHHPWCFPLTLLRSAICNKRLLGRYWPVHVRLAPGQKLYVYSSPSQNVQLLGVLSVNSRRGQFTPSAITLESGSTLIISGDYEIGPGVNIWVSKDATVKIAGRLQHNSCGMTSDVRIMAQHSIEIGYDSLISSDVLITDSDWHDIEGVQRSAAVMIGNKVWISHGVSILKGVVVPSGCIIASKSLVVSSIEVEKALVAGMPAVVKRIGVEWIP